LNLNLDNTSAGTDMKKSLSQGCWHVLAPLPVLSRAWKMNAADLAVFKQVLDIAGT
jgi:hypothetical protein